ncbi:MAG: hypothetical protein C4548_05970 [Desulfobacteraceae bacterium]|jgi:aspartyl-tRNA(Asn)/glutamyl-tRNA(Gln) amidotransferase subunit A|nr:MAG: hypothetical protein C4548_05970 [Desulfobacteraceae bacterium]
MTTDLLAYRPATPLQEAATGPLAGKTILVRPDLCVAGWLTDAGSQALKDFHAFTDAAIVTRLKAAGASFAGSTRMAELGFGVNGDAMARALSANHAHIGLMTDTMGEARVAACCAGCFGFKPSYGLISRSGLIGLAPSMECVGVLAGDLSDIASVLGVMAGPDENDFSMSNDPPPDFLNPVPSAKTTLRIGVPRECRDRLGPSGAAAFAAALDAMAGAGIEIIEVNLPGFDLFPVVHQIVAAVEASSAAGKYDGVRYGFRAESAKNWNEMYIKSRAEAFGIRIKAFLFQGAYFQFQDYPAFENACALRRRLVNETDDLFKQVDMLALPARHEDPDPYRAETVGDTYAAFGLTLAANVAGLPALHIPGLSRHAAMDFGLQLIGPRMADVSVLAAGLNLSTHIQGVSST